MSIKKLQITSSMNVNGVVNSNGKDGANKDSTYNNVICAKVFQREITPGVFETVDFTSGDTLRKAIFGSVDVQLSEADQNDLFIKKMASIVGILRGVLFTRSNKFSLKRKSPITVLDAPTVGKHIPFMESKTNSTPQELKEEKKSKAKEEGAKEKGGLGLRTKENYGPRLQAFEMIVDIAELQFLPLDYAYNNHVVAEEQEKEFIENLSNYFKQNKIDSKIEKGSYFYRQQIKSTSGILLSQEQQLFLVKSLIELTSEVAIYKATAKLEMGELFINGRTVKDLDVILKEGFHTFYNKA